MSWMVRMLRSDITNPWHWVSPAAAWCDTQRDPPLPPGYDTVCGERALPHPPSEHSPTDRDRSYCDACRDWLAVNHPDSLADLPPRGTAYPE